VHRWKVDYEDYMDEDDVNSDATKLCPLLDMIFSGNLQFQKSSICSIHFYT